MSARNPSLSVGACLIVLAGIHFANILDFMMVIPLGPDFAAALGIPMSHLGIVGGSYTAAAAIVGLIGSLQLDRYERRSALTYSVCGLALSTLAGAASVGSLSLIMTRVAAGTFGGIAGTLCFSIVTDLIPEESRGRAMAIVSSGFSLASIVGVPIGLELARLGSWRTPFIVVGLMTLALAGAARTLLPKLEGHMDETLATPLKINKAMGLAFLSFGCIVFGNFLVAPHFPAFLQVNLGVSRAELGRLYFIGGFASLATMRAAGIWTDRVRAFWPVLTCTICVSLVLLLGAVCSPPLIPPIIFFTAFMAFSSARWVGVNALASRIPEPSARARFLSAQNAFVHAACAVAGFLSVGFLSTGPTGKLIGMPTLAAIAAILGLGGPYAVWRLERRLSRR